MNAQELLTLLCSECAFPMGWKSAHPTGYIICGGCAEKIAEAQRADAAGDEGK